MGLIGEDGFTTEDNAGGVCTIDLLPMNKIVLESDGLGFECHGVFDEAKGRRLKLVRDNEKECYLIVERRALYE